MTYTIEISADLRERLDRHREDDVTYDELIAELVSVDEADGTFLQEGTSE